MSTAPSTHENRLARETSPYLLQHKHNPVEWWPWGPEALAQAKANNKPILLSVGYAACHWCHVMAHESFEDEATARVMNELFVNIKVDREERPDIDQIYMQALHHLGEQGGWPLTMFLTPAGEPVWGGTYFPPTSRYGRPAFVDVMREVARLFREEPAKIEQNRVALMSRLAEVARQPQRVTIGRQELDQVAMQLGSAMDPINGGLRGAPKFPQCTIFENLWRAGLRQSRPSSWPGRPGDDQNQAGSPADKFFHIIDLTLTRISEGGIYDHLGGGYSRYSVDDKWLVPHFEKMLYDNAQILDLLGLAWQRTGKMLYRERAEETVGWLQREMTSGEGAFYSSLDADSEGVEGKFYVWSLAEVHAALGGNAAVFAQHYDVTPEGNFEGHNILNRLKDLPRSMEIDAALPVLRSMLHKVREQRVRPGLDDKVLADWNALMIAALVDAGTAFWRPDWVEMAVRAFEFVQRNMTRGDRLGHSWREGRLLYPGLASDFAFMIRAALSLYEATGQRAYLDQALAWQAALDRHYANPDTGTYYLTADDAEGLVVRPASTADDATPNPNAIAAQNLIRLAAFTGEHRFRDQADRLIAGILSVGGNNLFMHVATLNAIDMRLNLSEIVVTGEGLAADALTMAALALPYVSRAVLRAPTAEALPAGHPAQDKLASAAGPAAFICIGETCSLPVTNPDEISARAAGTRTAS